MIDILFIIIWATNLAKNFYHTGYVASYISDYYGRHIDCP